MLHIEFWDSDKQSYTFNPLFIETSEVPVETGKEDFITFNPLFIET